jgi:hypothetical protein
MQRSCYSVEKYHDGWSVSVSGAKVLICESKKTALKVVRQATDALRLDQGVAPFCRGRLAEPLSEDLTAANGETAN